MAVDPQVLAKWQGIARTRLINILAAHGVANARTLEQKISDAGPFNQRIDPHILNPVLKKLVSEQVVNVQEKISKGSTSRWYSRADTPDETVQERLDAQWPVYQRLRRGELPKRIGQCLEIAIFRALGDQQDLDYLGGFQTSRNATIRGRTTRMIRRHGSTAGGLSGTRSLISW